MCGIVLAHTQERAQEMLDKIKHRGPDKLTVMKSGSLYMGHARLAIVDTNSAGAEQPLQVTDQYTVAFNGEVFNYKDLDASKTEIQLLAELMNERHDLAQLLNGYYAVVFHDISRNQVVLCRDYYGVMPLYYTEAPFEVASERKALNGHSKRVPRNSQLTYDLKTQRVKVRPYSQLFRMSGNTLSLDKLWLDAVRTVATHTDCGFSVALSGGLDSALVLAALKYLELEPTCIITTKVQGKDDAEVKRACEIVNQFKWSRLHYVVDTYVDPNVRYAIESPHNPIRDFAFMRHATVASNSPTKVLLCGEGADELGLGYPLNRAYSRSLDEYFKKVSLLKSQESMTLDRVNLAGMLHSKEYRVPFLDMDFSLSALTYEQRNKDMFRHLARVLDVPSSIIHAAKYSNEEAVGRSLLKS